MYLSEDSIRCLFDLASHLRTPGSVLMAKVGIGTERPTKESGPSGGGRVATIGRVNEVRP